MTNIIRRKTRKIRLGSMYIGGNSPISIQSMTNTDTANIKNTVGQIKTLEEAGCDIIRVSIPNMKSAKAIRKIKENIKIPLIADIHFDYRLAIESIKQGVDGLRLNPGNIKKQDKITAIVEEAKKNDIPIRIGVNAGSIDRTKYSTPTADNLVASAIEHIKILEDLNYYNIKVSLKATDVQMTIDSYKLMSKKRDYPLHLGVTEAGTLFSGSIKSAIGIGSLLSQGIGDTLRVSLTADPVEEIRVAKEILKVLGLRKQGIEYISCPTCARSKIDVIGISCELEKELAPLSESISAKLAVMGCIVNGPGEASNADIGISGGKGTAKLFKKGKPVKGRIDEKDIVSVLVNEVKKMAK